jgi:hypothetical protein
MQIRQDDGRYTTRTLFFSGRNLLTPQSPLVAIGQPTTVVQLPPVPTRTWVQVQVQVQVQVSQTSNPVRSSVSVSTSVFSFCERREHSLVEGL